MYSHYFASSSMKVLIITDTPSLRVYQTTTTIRLEFAVSGKREARKIAAEHNARPWNF